MESIPVVSIGSQFDAADPKARARAAELYRALESIGFAYIVDHGLPQALLDNAFTASREFHAASAERKASVKINDFHRGYMGYATSTIVTSSVAKVTKPNLSESIMFMHDLPPDDPDVLARKPLQGPNQWPDWMPGFRPAIEAYSKAIDAVARRLVHMIVTSLDLPQTHLDKYFERPTTFLRLLHYPPQPPSSTDDQFGSAPHTDYGNITLLAQDSSGGLQVKPRGRDWIAATPISGSFVLNVGDMLARWTNGRFVSTPHRVINKNPGDRYSIPYFFDPNMDTVIECLPSCTAPGNPPKYGKIRYGDYLMDRLNKNYNYRQHEHTAAGA
jgi:isopenicillin N synthase-like dioxygenase